MLASKTHGLFVEINDYSTLVAVTTGLEPPFTVVSLQELPATATDEERKKFFTDLGDAKGRFTQAKVGFYPKSRFLRRNTIESPAKVKDMGYFSDVLDKTLRIDMEANVASILNAENGREFNLEEGAANQKELLIVGAKTADIREVQDLVVELNLYPESLEIGSVSTLGALMHYARWKKMRFPTLALEITPSVSNVFVFSGSMIDISRPIPYGLDVMVPVIQEELGLKDEESARKLFASNTFDFTEMGPSLLRKMLKELQASTGFYEVQTGQTIGQIFTPLLPRNLHWIQTTLSRSLGVDALKIDYPGWLKELKISHSDSVQLEALDARWLSLFSLMGDYTPSENGKKES